MSHRARCRTEFPTGSLHVCIEICQTGPSGQSPSCSDMACVRSSTVGIQPFPGVCAARFSSLSFARTDPNFFLGGHELKRVLWTPRFKFIRLHGLACVIS